MENSSLDSLVWETALVTGPRHKTRLFAALLIAALSVAASGCGGGGGSGPAAPADVSRCLSDHGVVAQEQAPLAAHAANSIAINVKGSNLGPTEIELEIDYFKNAQDASSYLSLFVPSNAQPLTGKRLADGTVTAVWASNYGLGGPPELKTIEDCLGS